MPRLLLYIVMVLAVVAAGVASLRDESRAPLLERPVPAEEGQIGNLDAALLAARRSPYWRKLTSADQLTVDCLSAPGGWRFKARVTEPEELCELYVGRDRLIVPRLPCQGVGERKIDLP